MTELTNVYNTSFEEKKNCSKRLFSKVEDDDLAIAVLLRIKRYNQMLSGRRCLAQF